MAKFKVNDNVIVKDNNKMGTVVWRDEVHDRKNNRTEVKYYVKLGNGESNYKWFTRKELKKYVAEKEDSTRVKTRVYDISNGYKLTLVSIVETVNEFDEYSFTVYPKERTLRIGYSIYNPQDEYNLTLGQKIAKHRANNKPFTHMSARFTGEFNEMTTEAIMDAKAKYICENLDRFIKS